jgi:hypothetical protein
MCIDPEMSSAPITLGKEIGEGIGRLSGHPTGLANTESLN